MNGHTRLNMDNFRNCSEQILFIAVEDTDHQSRQVFLKHRVHVRIYKHTCKGENISTQ